jgi:thiamine pyrophosphate-dependent acetolactate synthase large subunit-like protein
MSGTVGDFMLERLSEWGVRRVYGYPGDGINGILGAFDRHENGLDFVQVAHGGRLHGRERAEGPAAGPSPGTA